MIDFGSVFESYSPSEKRKEMQEGCLVTWDQPASPGLYMSGTQVELRRHSPVSRTYGLLRPAGLGTGKRDPPVGDIRASFIQQQLYVNLQQLIGGEEQLGP